MKAKKLDLDRYIINIDKPIGPTSYQVADFVKKSLGLNKTSHFGTLDPKVSGVLPIALGRAVRLTGYFSNKDKEYVGIMRIHKDMDRKKIENIIKKRFLGKIIQLPPIRSKVKRQEREREIKNFEILEKKGQDILFKIECQAGTYIRKLCHDFGKEAKIGAHMTELRRTRASIFPENKAIRLYDFVKAVEEYKKGKIEKLKKMLTPIEEVKKIMPSLNIKKDFVERVKHGSPIFKIMISKNENFGKEEIAIFFNKTLIEIAKSEVESKNMKNSDLIAKPLTVFN